MNQLKNLRSRIGLTQKQVAAKLETTQQTIQRWESGTTEIPAGHLKDLSILFGCSVDELLGIDPKTTRGSENFARAKPETPWGSARFRFSFGERDYPVDDDEREALLGKFNSVIELKRPSSWLGFTALDNRLVLLNSAFISEVEFVSDDEETMPYFAPPEAYQALTTGNLKGAGQLLQETCARLMNQLRAVNEQGQPDLSQARQRLNQIELIGSDGRKTDEYISDDIATSIFILENERDVEPNSFLTVSNDGDHHRCVNLSHIAVIEVPVEAYLKHLAKDAD